jgi:hypothetical protein
MMSFILMEKNIIGVTLSSLITLIVLVILIGLSNLIPVENTQVRAVIDFFNTYIVTIILFILFFFLGELFYLFKFPLNIPGAVFLAYGGYFLTSFLFKLFYLIETMIGLNVFSQIKILEQIIALTVFFLVIIIGVAKIFARKAREERNNLLPYEKEVEWSDVGRQLKQASYNIAQKINESSKPKKSQNKDKKKKKQK